MNFKEMLEHLENGGRATSVGTPEGTYLVKLNETKVILKETNSNYNRVDGNTIIIPEAIYIMKGNKIDTKVDEDLLNFLKDTTFKKVLTEKEKEEELQKQAAKQEQTDELHDKAMEALESVVDILVKMGLFDKR